MDADIGDEGETYDSGLPEEGWNKFYEMTFRPTSATEPPAVSTGDSHLPNPVDFAEAVAWANSHEVSGKDTMRWAENRTKPTVDLRLAQSSLPIVSELLVSEDMPMARTALIALQLNGAKVETDAEWNVPSTHFDVIFPDGSERRVEFQH